MFLLFFKHFYQGLVILATTLGNNLGFYFQTTGFMLSHLTASLTFFATNEKPFDVKISIF